jgi:hypothetical protein
MNQRSISLFFFSLGIGLMSGHAAAAPQVPQSCAVTQRSEAVVLMLCPPAQTEVVWRAAAVKACEGKQRCNVWIWDDAAHVPTTAPATDAELPKAQTAKAVAIWAHDSQSLVSLRKAAKK